MKTMRKKSLALLLCLVLCLSLFPASAFADSAAGVPEDAEEAIVAEAAPEAVADGAAGAVVASGQCGDNLTWELDDEGTLTISGTGKMSEWNSSSSAPWYSRRSSILRVEIGSGVTRIGDFAFYDCSSLTSVTIPASVKSIGSYAFSGCSSLTSITIPESVTIIGYSAFYNCSSLTSITIPDGVTSIGSYAFSGCSSLTSITIPDGVTNIGGSAFSGCSSLTSITIPDGVTSIGSYAFSGCSSLTSITIPDGVTSIADYAFRSCSALTSITLPDGMTSIGDWAFSSCGSLAVISFPESLTSIGFRAFDSSSSLTSITLPNGMTSIGGSAFEGCSSLMSITIPSSVTSIGRSAFSGCSDLRTAGPIDGGYDYKFGWTEEIPDNAFSDCINLTSITIPEGVTSIGDSTFNGCSSLTSITIPESVTSIGNSAFYNCSSLTSITIPSSVTCIGHRAFQCTAMKAIDVVENNEVFFSIGGVLFDKHQETLIQCPGGMSGTYSIPEGVTSIGDDAFSHCSSLTSVTIPESVTSIGNSAFYNCSSLTSITTPSSVTSIGWGAFCDCSSLTSITISEGVTSIGEYAFFDCSSLKNITIPDGVTSICYQTFSGCSSLTSITIPEGVKSIASYAFSGCYSLRNVLYGGTEEQKDALINNGWDTWYNDPLFNATWHYNSCEATAITSGLCGAYGDNLTWTLYSDGELVISGKGEMRDYQNSSSRPWENYMYDICSLTVEEGVSSVGNNAFWCLYGCTIISLPESLKRIGDYAFVGIGHSGSSVTINIPSSLQFIGTEAFMDWPLTEFVFPESIIQVEEAVFRESYQLVSVTIPKSLVSASPAIFFRCPNLRDVYFKGTQSEWLAGNISSGFSHYAAIHCIDGDIAAYSTDYCGDDLRWSLEDSTLTVYGSGEMWEAETSALDIPPWDGPLQNVETIVIAEGVTSISASAFFCPYGLKDLQLPSTLRSIGNDAFSSAYQLESLRLPEGLESIDHYAFSYCGFTEVVLPETMRFIGSGAFSECENLAALSIPMSLADTSVQIAENCPNLHDIFFSGTMQEWRKSPVSATFPRTEMTVHCKDGTIEPPAADSCGDGLTWAIDDAGTLRITGTGEMWDWNWIESPPWKEASSGIISVEISQNVTSIGDDAFSGCSSLTSIVIPEGVMSIGGSAFSGCSSLTSVTLPDGLTSIGECAFYGCSGLTSITIPEGVTSIGEHAFSSCSALQSIFVPTSVTSIGYCAFGDCANLTAIHVASDSGAYASLDGVLFNKVMTELICCPSGKRGTYSVPEDVTSIGNSAFYNCSSLTSITTPSSVTSIGSCAFHGCASLTSITIPLSVARIGSSAFSGCTALSDVTYGGTAHQKARLTGNGWSTDGNDALFEAAWHCVEPEDGWDFCGDAVFWMLDKTARTLYIKGDGSMWDMTPDTIPWLSDLSRVYYVEIDEGVTGIGKQTFLEAGNLRRVTLPESLTSIGVSAFSGCLKLIDVVFPIGVTSIGSSALADCSSLREILFKGEPPMIASDSFSGVTATARCLCSGGWWEVDRQNYGGTLTWVEDHAWTETAYVFDPVGLTVTASRSCRIHETLTESETVALSKSLTMPTESEGGQYLLESAAFENAAFEQQSLRYALPALGTLSVLRMPGGLAELDEESFERTDCEAVILPASCRSVGSRAFKGCAQLRYVFLSAGTDLAADAFEGCGDVLLIYR